MNRVELVGRLVRDPEIRTSSNGTALTRFTIAVDRRFADKNGQRQADFIGCVAFERQASNIAKYCHKGSLVSVEGRIQTGSYDAQDGTKRYTTDIMCDNVQFLSPKSADSNTMSNNVDTFSPMNDSFETVDLSEDPYKTFSEEITVSSDDLPF